MDSGFLLYPLDSSPQWAKGRALDDSQIAELLTALTGRTGFGLGDLPPRLGLTWLIRWGGRSWPSSCGGFSTEYLVGRGGKLYLYNYGRVACNNLGGGPEPGEQAAQAFVNKLDYDLIKYLKPLLPEEVGAEINDKWTVFLPFTNMTAEYINMLFIYAGRGYPFRFTDSARPNQPFRSLGPEVIPEAFAFSLYELEMRILSLLMVEQAFALANFRIAAAGRKIAHASFQMAGSRETTGVVNDLLFGDKGFWENEKGKGFNLFTTPFYENMSEAIDAFLEDKWSSRQPDEMPYLEPDRVLAEIPYPSNAKTQRVKDFCEEIYQRYGRFPVYYPPLYTQIITLANSNT
ncbi:MAG: hypothetical protein ACYDG6_05520 [Thermincolia bacterium]